MTQTLPATSSLPERAARLKRPLIMGIVNATPDSFYAPGRSSSTAAAVERALRLAEEGADVIDVGGQSTRPGAEAVGAPEELARVVPVLEGLYGKVSVPLSIDTDKSEVAAAALERGARILNDVTALRGDPRMARRAVQFEAVILMHRGGAGPKTMQDHPVYADVFAEVEAFLVERIEAFLRAGGSSSRVFIDPGIGFGKTAAHNLTLLKRLRELGRVAPVALGVSRKSFLSAVSPDRGPEERLPGSLAAACWAASAGVKILRVHDVEATRRALDAWAAIEAAP